MLNFNFNLILRASNATDLALLVQPGGLVHHGVRPLVALRSPVGHR